MAKKKTNATKASERKRVQIDQAWPGAVSLRSNAAGACTVLCDAAYIDEIRKLPFNPVQVALSGKPRNHRDQLRRRATKGKWMAIQSRPDILDSDGVPGLDLVRRSRKLGQLGDPGAPSEGFWYDRVSQQLDLSSGQLLVIYDETLFDRATEITPYEIGLEQQDITKLEPDYFEADAYLIDCPMGICQVDVFTRFEDSYSDNKNFKQGIPADLVVFLTATGKPLEESKCPLLQPYKPTTQDAENLLRESQGLPPREAPIQPQIQENGVYEAPLRNLLGISTFMLPAKFKKQLGLKYGVQLTLTCQGIQLDGVIMKNPTPDPSVWDQVNRVKRKAKNYAIFCFGEDSLIIHMVKQSKSTPFEFPPGTSANATLAVTKDAHGETLMLPTKRPASQDKDCVAIPKKAGKLGSALEEALPMMDQCFGWVQSCLFELQGRTMIGAIQVLPGEAGTDCNGKPFRIAPEINATIAEVKDGQVGEESVKRFRGWPGGVERAFNWLAKQAAGGKLWTKRFEIELDFWGRKRTVKKRDAQQAALKIWEELFEIDLSRKQAQSRKPRSTH